jgi:hypothetical protein
MTLDPGYRAPGEARRRGWSDQVTTRARGDEDGATGTRDGERAGLSHPGGKTTTMTDLMRDARGGLGLAVAAGVTVRWLRLSCWAMPTPA